MPAISVILPTADRSSLLGRAVASVIAQGERDFELLIVDNNRRTPPVPESHRGAAWLADARVRIIQPGRRSNAAVARNAGLDHASGDWVTYLDDDDAYRPPKLAAQLALARRAAVPLVLCGAEYHLRGRQRRVQCNRDCWRGDDLILRARWNTPLLFHRRSPERFDESLSPGEDAEFAHRILANAGAAFVPIVPAPLVDIHPQTGPRVNTNADPLRASAARILALRPGFYSAGARRRFVLWTLLAIAKLRGQPRRCVQLGCQLLRESGGADWRVCANALLASLGIARDRWVS